MATVAQTASGPCPFASGPERNDSKSAALAAQRVRIEEGAEPVRAYEQARRVLLDKTLLQGGAGADSFDASEFEKAVIGPSGNLRAPTIRTGKTWFVGFHEEAYTDVFGG